LTHGLRSDKFHTHTDNKNKNKRTKTLLLSGVVAALSGACAMAQVYSLNAVGYINVTVVPGFSIIANQLNTTNNNISPLLDSQLLDGGHNGVILFKYNAAGGSFSTFSVSAASLWSSPGVTTTTLNPGEAAFIFNPFSTNFTLTFVGTVMQGSLTNTLLQGFNLISSIVPQSGALDTALGDVPNSGDQIFILQTSGSYTSDVWNGVAWSTGSGPVPAVGQGFWYFTPNSAGLSWVRTFNVN
jgi:hypothetical protein